MSSDVPYHAYDRAVRDAFRHSVVDVVEGLFGRRVAPGAEALQTQVERGPLEVDGLVMAQDGAPIHVEFQTRADRDLNFRMTRYFAALDHPDRPPPEQHVLLLSPDADRESLGEHLRGGLHLRFEIHRLWHIDPEALFARPGLLRLAPLAQAADNDERVELLRRAAREIRAHFAGDEERDNLLWTSHLANLYLPGPLVARTLEVMHMPIDLSETSLIKDAVARGVAEGEDSARRNDLRRIVRVRFGDQELAERTATVPKSLFEDAFDLAVTAANPDEIRVWLQTHGH